jgi:hypothetical protein
MDVGSVIISAGQPEVEAASPSGVTDEQDELGMRILELSHMPCTHKTWKSWLSSSLVVHQEDQRELLKTYAVVVLIG